MFTVTLIFLLAAFVTAILSALGKCPHWVTDILLWILIAIQILPLK